MNKISDIFKNKSSILDFIEYLKEVDLDFFIDNIFPKLTYDNIVKITDLIDVETIDDLENDIDYPVFQKRNPKVKNPYLNHSLTPIQILVKKRCKSDIIYFAEKFYYITSLDKGFIKIKLREYQKVMLQLLSNADVTHKLKYFDPNDASIDSLPKYECSVNFKKARFKLLKLSRQSGKTVTSGIFMCWLTQFFDVKRIGVLANNQKLAWQILDNIRKGYEALPFWLKQGVVVYNKGEVEFENNSIIKCSATTANAFTGFSLNVIFFDEVAKISPTIFTALQNSLIPTLSSGTDSQIIFSSTTFGKNFYFDLFVGALNHVLTDGKEGNGIVPLEFTYLDIPERASKEWATEQIKKLGEEGHAQENMGKFLAASGTLINGYKLSMIKEMLPVEDDYISQSLSEYAEYISIYDKPEENHIYTIIIDPNESNGSENKDKTKPNAMGIQIIDVTDISKGWKQAGTGYISGDSPVHYLELAPIGYFLAKYYNDAVLFIENNIAGKEIGNKIYNDYMYEKIFQEKREIFGYRLKQNKLLLCKMLKFMIENNVLTLQDGETVRQLKSFIKKGISYSAMLGYEDDCVTPLLGAMLLLLFDEDTIATYFPEGFTPPNKFSILEEVYKLNPNANKQFETMHDLVIKIQDDVKSEIDKLFDMSNYTIQYNYNNSSQQNQNRDSSFF